MYFFKKNEEAKEVAKVVEIQLPSIGKSLNNINVSPVPGTDPILLTDSSYPEWIWKARGPCRAALKSLELTNDDVDGEIELSLSELKKYLRSENRKSIRNNNSVLKGGT